MMRAALGAAELSLGKVLTKLSGELVASSELGLTDQISHDLTSTHALLQQAQGRDVAHNPAITDLLVKLTDKAGEAEDALNELQDFIIQDQLDGIHLNVMPGYLKVNKGNWFPCFSCCCTRDPQHGSKSDSGDHVHQLAFDSVSMSVRIKSLIQEMHSICQALSGLLPSTTATPVIPRRPVVGSAVAHDRLYGRSAIFEHTIGIITSCSETLSVIPVFGPGGIGKTTFVKHIYNDARTQQHFAVRIWVCVSFDFNVLKLTQQILRCIPATEEEEGTSGMTNEITNLDQLQISIARRLESKRFLFVLDDVWALNSHDEWNNLLAPFTKGETKGNVVLVTTRFPSIAHMVKTLDPIELQGLNPEDFATFFEACIFGDLSKPEHYKDGLLDIARSITTMLNGSPLAAKTVGRLLRNDLSPQHWKRVLENKEWENETSNNDIMSALYISYDYLPFLLQKCFSYLSLFPKDYRFSNSEINRFWIAVGIIDSSQLGNYIYFEELVGHGFLMTVDGKKYVMHDLMHELSRSVSTQECLNVSDMYFRADTVPQSIRHLSITIENIYHEHFLPEMSKLKKRIDIANLRTLMFFNEYGEIISILKDAFKKVNSLHVLFIVVKSLDYLPQNFSKLIHLQYLKLGSPKDIEINLPSTLSRFYHMQFLDLEDWHGSSNLPKDISHLVNLQDFLATKELHSSVAEVGKMKYLRELKEFCVKKEIVGFELRQLGELTELGGELSICNLENVATKEEASEAKLISKNNLKKLTLVWGRKQPPADADILDALQPHPNLRELHIANYGAAVGPSWLGQLPLLTRLILTRISGVHQLGIHDMVSLESLMICKCDNMFFGCFTEEAAGGTETMKPFPASLKKLAISSDSSIKSMSLISNLTSLTHLTLQDCLNLTVDGFNPLIIINLKVLVVFNCRWDRSCPESVAAGLLSEVASSRVMPQLEQLKVDSISAVLVAPICNLVASTLHTLIFCHDQRAKSFTEEQEKVLLLLTSLRHLGFDACGALQSLPRGLHRLSSLRDLHVLWCPEIRSIPKEGFPVSLRNLRVRPCSANAKEQIEKLRRTNPDLFVSYE